MKETVMLGMKNENNTEITRLNNLVGEQLKANRRMSGWAVKPNGKAHKLLKAFCIAEGKNGQASISTMRLLCSDPKAHPELYIGNFNHWLSDLKTEAGDSSGKVFEQVGEDHVGIWEPIRQKFNEYKNMFA